MCGIAGYIGRGDVAEILLSSLKKLEYRGYDSAGLALGDKTGVTVCKAEGKLENLVALVQENPARNNANRGIGHIRWATHGCPTLANAHPHVSADGMLALVHNGIIENYQELKTELQGQGVAFSSSTDTEAAVHLMASEYARCQNLEQAVVSACRRLRGSFAFCAVHAAEPDKIVVVRQNAPLILGISADGSFVASDILALVGVADSVINLDDGELAVVRADGIVVKDFAGTIKPKTPEPLRIGEESIGKRGYPHYMLKEIMEQPDIFRRLLGVYQAGAEQSPALEEARMLCRNINKVEIIACGTSLHAAEVAKSAMEELCRLPVEITPASEYVYKCNLTDEKTLVIGISQSGETADTLAAVRLAKETGAKILVLTNRPNSAIVRLADAVLPLEAGAEISVAATKSYTAQLAVLLLLALAMVENSSSLSAADTAKIRRELAELPAKMEEVLSSRRKIKAIAERYASVRGMIFIARGINRATAREGALKLKEISYINAVACAAGELKHGTIALLDENMPVVALLPQGITQAKMLANCAEAAARSAPVFGIMPQNTPLPDKVFDTVVFMPEVDELLSPLLYALPVQLFAYYAAVSLGREVDQPRNLAKSVTVE